MDQLLTFISGHPILIGAFAVVLAALIGTEFARVTRRWNEVDTTQAILLINRQDPVILDVSNSTDYANGHILNAEHMPPSRIESGNNKLLKKTDRPVLVYCKNGQVSPQMAKRLVSLGFEDVNVLRGGLAQWISDQQPVTRGKSGKSGDGRQNKRGGKQGKRNKRAGPAGQASTAEPEKTSDASPGGAASNNNGG